MIRRMVMVGLLTLGLSLGMSLAPSTPASAAPADDIYTLVNEARWANGQAGLIRNAVMDQVAADWAATMAANGTMAHNPDYASQIPGGWSAAAENVAQGYPSGAAMHNGWMGSSGHRANILGNFTDIGIAFLSSGGTTWGVQVFGRYAGHVGPAAPAPPLPPPPPPAPAPAPPGEPAPGEPAPGETPHDPTSTPSPSATSTPTAPATATSSGDREAIASGPGSGTAGVSPGWWALVAGAAAVAAAAASTILRRRTPS